MKRMNHPTKRELLGMKDIRQEINARYKRLIAEAKRRKEERAKGWVDCG